jgi:hypothetical protein
MEDGRRELPKPPRRIPSWATVDDEVTAGRRTVIQPRIAQPPAPAGKPPRGPGPLAIIPLVVIVLVVGVGAGWLLHSKDDTPANQPLDTIGVLRASGPSVVRILATTCAGSGEGTGVLFDNGRVLTAASAIRQPVAVALVTSDGRIRRATVVGTSPDGVAVLHVPGRLDASTAMLASASPDAGAEQAVVGYDQAGKQTIQKAGTTGNRRPLAEFLDPTSLGGPVVNGNGQVTGLVTGNTVATGKVIGLEDVRRYAGSSPGVTPEPTGTCSARGPLTVVRPVLTVPATALATEIQQLFTSYLKALNQHDFLAMQDTYSRDLASNSPKEAFDKAHGTSYAFGPVISEVGGSGRTTATARMTFAVLFSPQSTGAKGKACARLDLRYRLVREQGRLRIDSAVNVTSNQSCDSD